ncbi:SpoIID/LytB domain-containing protein [Hymenobacter terrenus]|uniref:SpoIID/LytB domain-containing protein n=1 Tax=Hymenobacter terrenus TaxID=1629124 RepID=UPI000619EB21|nr:SpoIID/LytB domain-containing protein [Hymenobacter terrenus]
MASLPFRTTLLSGALAFISLGAWAQKGTIELRVIDQQTGFAVRNARVELLGPAGRPETLASRDNGKLALPNREGNLTFLISAPGYAPLTTQFRAGDVAQLNAEVQLDPLQRLLPRQQQRSAPAANQTLIDGYVSDREQGSPLAGVEVRIGAATAVSDAAGYYQLVLSGQGSTKEEFVKQREDVTFSRDGYVSYQLPAFRIIGANYTFKTALAPLAKGAETRLGRGSVPTETLSTPHGFFDKTGAEPEPLQDHKAAAPATTGQPANRATAVAVPTSIRVGTSCSCNSCSNVTVLSLESYVRTGLDNEWIASWGSNSLRAGAIAYRSYGAYHVSRPIATNYDISSTTCRQVWDGTEVASTRDAANATQGMVLVKNGSIAFAEYSSENNNSGCGNGFAGLGTTVSPCISDPLCAGRAKFGHGRGMCQFGTSFWHNNGKTYLWIVDHYYTPTNIVLQSPTAADSQVPTTGIEGPVSATGNFTATFNDADNVGVTASFYQPLEWRTDEWRANRGNGFYNDNFGNGTLHSDYVPGLADWQGTWAETTAGTLRQSDVTPTNTALSTFLSQTAGNTYLYNFAAKVNNTAGARRFGLHIMASDVTLRERGNSYLIWFAIDQQKVTIYEVNDNVLTTQAVATVSLSSGTFSDYKVLYNTSTGAINVYQNNNLVTSWQDPTPLTSGANISLRTSEADVEFDDLKVFKARGTSATITVGAANTNDIRTSASPGAKIKSLVKDAADNWSTLGNLDVNIAIPAAAARPAADEAMASVYPNPITDGKLTISYALDADAEVAIDIYDSRGTKVKTLVSRELRGAHQVAVPAQTLGKQGIYLVKLSTGEKSQVVRVLKD